MSSGCRLPVRYSVWVVLVRGLGTLVVAHWGPHFVLQVEL